MSFIEAPAPDTILRLRSAGMNVVTLTYAHDWGDQLNFTDEPFNDMRVRRAVNHTIDCADMDDMLGGTALAGYSTAPPGHVFQGTPVR